MYINDIHILYYLCFGIVGVIIGQFIDWCNIRLPEYKKVLSKDFFRIYIKNIKPKYILMIINALIYVGILYYYGINDIRTYEYLFLTPILISAFYIDYKSQIIPNRLTLTLLEIGLIFTFINGVSNLNVAIDRIMGFFVGIVIFLIITFLGKLFSGKEAVGFGDVKLISVLGLFFGWRNIIAISIISFLIAAIVSIVLLLVKRKSLNVYIAFGPFIVISSILIMFVPVEEIIMLLVNLRSSVKI